MSTSSHCQRSEEQVKISLNASGSQRYPCKVCRRKYTPEAKQQGYSPAVQLFARITLESSNVVDAVSKLANDNKTQVVLSLGSEGAICAASRQVWQVHSPQLVIQSAVGSGDCMLAGIVYGLTHAFTFPEAIRYGSAAGTANALSIGTGVFMQTDFERVLSQVVVTQL